ncbi:MAG: branched-chain amino acid ABC transporter permease [Egibacteraceae bacterium]
MTRLPNGRRIPLLLWGLVAIGVVLVPFAAARLTAFLVVEALMFGAAAVSLNLLIGYGKMVSFGHAAWWGVGSYATGVMLQRYTGLGILGAMATAVLISSAVAAAVGFFCVRRGTIYFAMLTLAFSQLVALAILRMRDVTGGEQGLTGGVPRPPIGPLDVSSFEAFYYFTAVVCLLAVGGMAWFLASPFGLSLRALASNPERAAATGINVQLHQWATFVVSSAFASVGGGLHAIFQSSAFPEALHWTTSAVFVFMGLVGGIGHFAGPLVGAFVYIWLERFAGTVLDARDLVLGVLLLFIVLVMRGGVTGAAVDAAAWVTRRFAGSEVAPPEPDDDRDRHVPAEQVEDAARTEEGR